MVSRRLGKETYFRLVSQDVLPNHIDRCLYLDVDVVVQKNIADFYYQDFDGNFLIATAQSLDYKRVQKEKKSAEKAMGSHYFNAGVLIFNLDALRDNISINTYLNALESFENQKANDQQLLNYVFYEKTKYENLLLYNFRYSAICAQEQRNTIQQLYHIRSDEIRYIPRIIHFTSWVSFGKPWDLCFGDHEIKKYTRGLIPGIAAFHSLVVNEEQNYFSRIWWKYAQRTPIYMSLLTKMHVKKEWYKRQVNDIVAKYYAAIKSLNSLRHPEKNRVDFMFIDRKMHSSTNYEKVENFVNIRISPKDIGCNFYRYSFTQSYQQYSIQISQISADFPEYTAGIFDFKNNQVLHYETCSTSQTACFNFVTGQRIDGLAFCIYAGIFRKTHNRAITIGSFTVMTSSLSPTETVLPT